MTSRPGPTHQELALSRAGVGLFSFDPASGLRVNASYLAILGRSPSEVPEGVEASLAWFAGLVHPEDAGPVVAEQRTMLGGGETSARDFRVRHASGEYLWMRGVVHREGETLYGSITDIRRLVDAQGAASLTEWRLRAIFENVPVMIDSFDQDGQCVLWNRECERCLGYTAEEVRKHRDPLALFYPDSQTRQAVVEALAEPDGEFREYTVQSRESPRTQRWANFRLLNGETIGVGFDVTEQRALVEALEASNRDLEEFAYVASHDLQEPLRMVRTYVGLLVEEVGDDLGDDGQEYARFAAEGAERMQLLIRDLLRYARVQRANQELRSVDLNEVVKAALGDFDGAAVEVGELPTVVGDANQLERLVGNLLSNALKFRHPDRAPRVRVQGARTGSGWRLEVRDNGVGIAPEFHAKVFGMFQRLHSRGEYDGTGIGLAICKRIVRRHGGRITLRSARGEGATFIVEVESEGADHER